MYIKYCIFDDPACCRNPPMKAVQYDLNHTFLFHCLVRNSLLLLSKRFFNDSIEVPLGWLYTLSWEPGAF